MTRRPAARGARSAPLTSGSTRPIGAPDEGQDERALLPVGALGAIGASWVSAGLVRQAIGAWAYTLPGAERRPDAQDVREAIAVACAARELAVDPDRRRWAEHDARGEAASEVPRDPGALAERSGLDVRTVERALTLLERVGVLATVGRGAAIALALDPGVLAVRPVVGRLAWGEVRARLRRVGCPPPAALAVLRELAAEVGAVAEGELPAPIRLSVRALEERTGYGRSTVADALAGLERARLLDVEARAGRTARFTLRPAAFGHAEPTVARARADDPAPDGGAWGAPPSDGARAPASGRAAARREVVGTGGVRLAAGADGVAAAGGTRSPARAPALPAHPAPLASEVAIARPSAVAAGGEVASVRLGEFAGTPIHGPPGTPLVVVRHADGSWSCRVGPFLVLGPVREPGDESA